MSALSVPDQPVLPPLCELGILVNRSCIVEKGPLGGSGVHNGALSSKTLWELSRDYINASRRDRGYIAENVEIDFSHVVNCVHRAIDEKVSQILEQFAALSQLRLSCPNCINLVRGNARFLD